MSSVDDVWVWSTDAEGRASGEPGRGVVVDPIHLLVYVADPLSAQDGDRVAVVFEAGGAQPRSGTIAITDPWVFVGVGLDGYADGSVHPLPELDSDDDEVARRELTQHVEALRQFPSHPRPEPPTAPIPSSAEHPDDVELPGLAGWICKRVMRH